MVGRKLNMVGEMRLSDFVRGLREVYEWVWNGFNNKIKGDCVNENGSGKDDDC